MSFNLHVQNAVHTRKGEDVMVLTLLICLKEVSAEKQCLFFDALKFSGRSAVEFIRCRNSTCLGREGRTL